MIRGLWDRETVALLLVAAALPVATGWLILAGWDGVARLTLVTLCIWSWHLVWMLARAVPPSLAGLVTALAIAILAPEDLGIMPMLLGISFGVVFGDLALGGWGRTPLNPATITLAFLGFGFPAAPWPEIALQLGWAAIPATAIGVATGLFSLRLLLGAGIVFALGNAAGIGITDIWPAILLGLVLLVCDPVASAATRGGRWMNGALFAGLSVLFHATWAAAAPVQIVVSAALLASLAAPLLDEIAIAVWLARRKRRLDKP